MNTMAQGLRYMLEATLLFSVMAVLWRSACEFLRSIPWRAAEREAGYRPLSVSVDRGFVLYL